MAYRVNHTDLAYITACITTVNTNRDKKYQIITMTELSFMSVHGNIKFTMAFHALHCQPTKFCVSLSVERGL